MTSILKVLVGSRAHGLHTETSDYDYRGVYVRPTREILALGAKPHTTQWSEADKAAPGDKLDDTSWEIGHFLSLATHCNPTILEVLAAPPEAMTEVGQALRDLLPHIWHPKGVRDAFLGYGWNQRKKFLDDKDQRASKYACAYLRVLYQAYGLLNWGDLLVDMRDTGVYLTLKAWKAGDYTKGEVIDVTSKWQELVEEAASVCDHQQDLGPVNDFLLDVRKRYW